MHPDSYSVRAKHGVEVQPRTQVTAPQEGTCWPTKRTATASARRRLSCAPHRGPAPLGARGVTTGCCAGIGVLLADTANQRDAASMQTAIGRTARHVHVCCRAPC